MSIFRGPDPNVKMGTCKRCGCQIVIRKEGQEYGRVCERKEAAKLAALERYGKIEKEVLV